MEGQKTSKTLSYLNGDGTRFAHVVAEHHVVETLHSADRQTLLVQNGEHLLAGQHLGRHSLHLHIVLLRDTLTQSNRGC